MDKRKWLSKLTPARASQLVPGGIFYLRNEDATFSTVSLDVHEQHMEGFREWVKEISQEGRIYLRLDKPNYPLTVTEEIFTEHNIKQYEQSKNNTDIKKVR